MSILQNFEALAKNKASKIGIGLGISDFHNKKILKAILNFLEEYSSTIYIFGNEKALDHIREKIDLKYKKKIFLIQSKKPEEEIFKSLKRKIIHSIIRGSLSSKKFLEKLKNYLDTAMINRLALLETADGYQFFYGPVGIDECNNAQSKIEFLESALKELESLNICPNISVLSGGRLGDIGRDNNVDTSIKIGENTVKAMKGRYPNLKIRHDEILIENAIKNKSNLIIAPDGISGNLIYRTLVHLGGGKAYGAIYMGLENNIIDTSRVGDLSEIQGALILALALS
ncbi:MAG: methanogenesis marker protein Mmp4/MtxX [Promethearchaeota archaeon]